jgi:hypothetical protein
MLPQYLAMKTNEELKIGSLAGQSYTVSKVLCNLPKTDVYAMGSQPFIFFTLCFCFCFYHSPPISYLHHLSFSFPSAALQAVFCVYQSASNLRFSLSHCSNSIYPNSIQHVENKHSFNSIHATGSLRSIQVQISTGRHGSMVCGLPIGSNFKESGRLFYLWYR